MIEEIPGRPTWKPRVERNGKSVYLSIAEALESDIGESALKPGDRLPPQRDLADFLGVNLTTVTKAYRVCERKGLICATVGKGTFVSSDANIPGAAREEEEGRLIEMGMLHPRCGQSELVGEAIRRVAQQSTIGSFFDYDEPRLKKSQGETGVEWLKRFRRFARAEDVLVASGAQNALAVTLLSLFQAGDRIGVDCLTYMGFKSLANLFGIRLLPIEMSDTGMSAEGLERACKAEKLKGLYLMPECQNPTTCTMDLSLRRKIAQIVSANRLILIEDGTYSFLGNTELPPVSELAPEQSVYISSTSKSLSAGLRVAFMAVAPQFRDRVSRGIYSVNLNTSHFNVAIVADLVATKAADQILRERRREAEARNKIVDEALGGFTVRGNKRDLFRWLILPEGWTGKEFELCAQVAGVRLFCADRFSVGGDPAPAAVRIATSSVGTRGELIRGLDILKGLLREEPGKSPLIV